MEADALDIMSKASEIAAAPMPLPKTSPQHVRTKSAAYLGSEQNIYLNGWNPALRDPRWDIGSAWGPAAAKSIDSIQNSGWISGAIDAAIGQIVGSGLRLNARPDHEALGWTQDEADKWAAAVERKWEIWGNDPKECDMYGRMTISQFQIAALRQYFATGEIICLLPYLKRYNSPSGTKFQLMPSNRLDIMSYTAWGVVQGVQMDEFGFPIGYRFRIVYPDNGYGVEQFVTIPARDDFGRPHVIHVFDVQAGAIRGISPLTPVLKVVRQFDQLADATLTATLLQTIFAATLESQAPTEQMLDALNQSSEIGAAQGMPIQGMDTWFAARAGWYDGTTVDLGNHGKIAHLFPGENLKFNKVENPTDVYEPFAKFLLREAARCLGLTFEQMTGDYSGATYSSVRMASADFWNLTINRRTNIIGRAMQTIYEAWLEEQIDIGSVEIPGGIEAFLANKAAICRADWRGPPKSQADDLKLAQAHQIWKGLGVLSDEMLCNDLGVDVEDVYAQIAQERQMKKEMGIDEASIASEMTQATTPPSDPNNPPQDNADG
jgi:lambda family phage portal protein